MRKVVKENPPAAVLLADPRVAELPVAALAETAVMQAALRPDHLLLETAVAETGHLADLQARIRTVPVVVSHLQAVDLAIAGAAKDRQQLAAAGLTELEMTIRRKA